MTWGIDRDELEAGRDQMRAPATGRASHRVLDGEYGAHGRGLWVTAAHVAGLRAALLDEAAGELDCDVCGNDHGVHGARELALAQARFRKYR